MRKPIPIAIEADLQFKNKHTCCICRTEHKDVQIHHIDSNNNNNAIHNLAVVCLDCHSKITGRRGLGKNYSHLEVIKYKRNWESTIKRQRSLGLQKKSLGPHQDSTLKIEVKKILYKIASTDKITEIKENLQLLYVYNIYGIHSHYILDEIYYLTAFLYGGEKGKHVSKRIVSFFDYLPGPDVVKLSKIDVKTLDLGIKVLIDIGIASAEYNRNISLAIPTLDSILDSLYQLFLLISMYRRYKLIPRVIEGVKLIRRTVLTEYEGEVKLYGISKKCDYYITRITQKWVGPRYRLVSA